MKATLLSLTALAVLSVYLVACGAFADAAGDGKPDGGPTLTFAPVSWISQGQRAEYTISFVEAPPWAKLDGGTPAFISEYDFGGEDLQHVAEYDGLRTIQATLRATNRAQTGDRIIRISAAKDRLGQKQLTHTGWGIFYVLPRMSDGASSSNTDGGTDGGGE